MYDLKQTCLIVIATLAELDEVVTGFLHYATMQLQVDFTN